MAKQTKKRFRKSKRKQSHSLQARNNKYRTTMKSRRKRRVVMRGGEPNDNKYVFNDDIILSSKDENLKTLFGVISFPDLQIDNLLNGMTPGQIAHIYSGGDDLTLTLTEDMKCKFGPKTIKRQMINGPGKLVVRTPFETLKRTNMNSYTITGTFVNGEVSGQGTIQWLNGDKYEGNIQGNKANGDGIYSYGGKKYRGNTFTGFFKDNNIVSGTGFVTGIDGSVYEGEILDSKMHGYGKYTSGGKIEEGIFENNMKNGEFITTENGEVYKGYFRYNVRQGPFTCTLFDGTKYTGTYKDGSLDGNLTITDSCNKVVAVLTYSNGDIISPAASAASAASEASAASAASATAPVPVPAPAAPAASAAPVPAPAAQKYSLFKWPRVFCKDDDRRLELNQPLLGPREADV